MKKLLIVTDNNDTAINKICLWLNYYKIEYLRLNTEMLISTFQIILNDTSESIYFKYGEKNINLLDFGLIYFRRGYFQNPYYFDENDFKSKEISSWMKDYLLSENTKITNYVLNRIKNKSINSPLLYNMDKLTGMYFAKECGFKIPSSRIVNGEVKINKKNKYFVKPVYISPDILANYKLKKVTISSKHIYINNTSEIKNTNTLIQSYIEKKIELRVFYFLGFIFASAIYSQLNESSIYDSRILKDRNIRYIPYNLNPEAIKKINKLMDVLGLESASLDFIIDEKNELIFLEVNPVGMFDYIGYWSGGISLEKSIVEKIIQKLNEN